VSLAQRFAQIFGVIYLLVGILGFIPPLFLGMTAMGWGPFGGYLLGLFAVNWFHSLAHVAIGVGGLATFRNADAARYYSLRRACGTAGRISAAQRVGQRPASPDGAGGIRGVLLLGPTRSREGCVRSGAKYLADA
jgi:Domain of unknown function (DUF4383)